MLHVVCDVTQPMLGLLWPNGRCHRRSIRCNPSAKTNLLAGHCQAKRRGLQILAKAQIRKNVAWTVPTLVGTKLYLRDRRTITTLELG